MITVAELIEMLSKFDGGARVLVSGYEDHQTLGRVRPPCTEKNCRMVHIAKAAIEAARR